MSHPHVWITGAGGLIGNYLVQTAPQYAPGWRVRALTRPQLDLADFATVRKAFSNDPPALLIHCAALSKTPACQANPALARTLNVEITARLVELAADIPFVFISSDLVFDGKAGNYDESSSVSPLSVYGENKVEAEKIVLAKPRHLVIRTSLNAGTSPTGDRGFNEELRHAWATGKTTRLYTDEFRCPLHASITARALWEMTSKGCSGLYHVTGRERLSRWECGQLIARRWPQLKPQLEAASVRDHAGPPRAPDTSLNCAKAQSALTFPLPHFSDWVAEHPDEIV
jgi:dTDP-4-dehydrorhamnose reductase